MARTYTKDMVGDILYDFKEYKIISPWIEEILFGLRMDNPAGFLDTGFIPNTVDTVVELDVQYATMFGPIRDGAQNPANVRFYMGIYNSQWETGFAGTTDNNVAADLGRHLHTLTGEGNRYVDGVITTVYPGSITSQLDTFLLWGKGSYFYPGTTYYGVRMWKGGELKRDLRPIRQGLQRYSGTPAPSDCFWDMVNEEYLEPNVAAVPIDLKSVKDTPEFREGVSVTVDTRSELIDLIQTYMDMLTNGVSVSIDMKTEHRELNQLYLSYSQVGTTLYCDLSPEIITFIQTQTALIENSYKVTVDLHAELISAE